MKQSLSDSVLDILGRMAANSTVIAVKDGMGLSYPLIMLGSIALLIAHFPLPGWTEFFSSWLGADWQLPFEHCANLIFGFLAVYIALGIGYKSAEKHDVNAMLGAFLAVVTFFIMLPASAFTQGNYFNSHSSSYFGAGGMLLAILAALITVKILAIFKQRNFCLPAPSIVPDGVVGAFSELIPGITVLVAAGLIARLSYSIFNLSVAEIMQLALQAPLQWMIDSILGGMLITALSPLLFWAGLHGPSIIGVFVDPFLTANALENQLLINTGANLVNNHSLHIVTQQLYMFVTMGGCGLTVGLVLAILLCGRSKQLCMLGKTAIVPSIFNINEPLIFGLPIVFNPYFIVPFVLSPLAGFIITYMAINIGFMPAFSAIQVLWPTPPIISGFLLAGWQGAVTQLVCILASMLIYMPFVKRQDRDYMIEESK